MTGHAPGDVGMVAVDAGVDDRDRRPRVPSASPKTACAVEAAERGVDPLAARRGDRRRRPRSRPAARRSTTGPAVAPVGGAARRASRPRARPHRGRRPGAARCGRRGPTSGRRRVPARRWPATPAPRSRPHRAPHRPGPPPNPESTSASTPVASARTRPRRTALAARPAIEVATSRSRIENVPPCRSSTSSTPMVPDASASGHGQQRRRHVAGRLRHRPLEPGICGDVGDGQRLARRERRSRRCRSPARSDMPTMSPAAGPAAAVNTSRSVLGSCSAIDAACASSAATATPATATSRSSSPAGVRRSAAARRRATAASSASTAPLVRGHRRAASARRPASGMTSSSPSNRSEALGHEVGQEPVHRLARAADHPGQLALGVWPRKTVLADEQVGVGRVAAARERQRPQDVPSEPTGQVQEMEVLDLRREPADLAGQGDQDRVAEDRLVVDERVERVTPQDVGLAGVERDRRRRARRPVEQRQHPEETARPDRREDGRLRSVVRRDRDLDRAVGHDEQRVARVAGVEDRLALAEPARPERGGAQVERRGVHVGEQAACAQRVARRRAGGGRTGHAPIVRASVTGLPTRSCCPDAPFGGNVA